MELGGIVSKTLLSVHKQCVKDEDNDLACKKDKIPSTSSEVYWQMCKGNMHTQVHVSAF